MKFINRKFVWLILSLFIFSLQPSAQEKNQQIILPVKYDEHRFYVQPVTRDNIRLNFFTDTGGGLFIYHDSAAKFKLINSGEKDKPIELPEFQPASLIPIPLGSGGKLFLLERKKEGIPAHNYDGMLGQAWFADRSWTFDYRKKRLILWNKAPELVKKDSKNKVILGFKTDKDGKRVLSFPRIQVEIDGEVLDLLFDTGATTYLTKEALSALKDRGASERATSFITNSTFEKWRKKYPNWRVIEKAEATTSESMIEVPSIKIAGYKIGPVWFTRRADKNFHEFMSKFMDKKVEGAIGGNALKHFRITVDYPSAIAIFEKN